MVKIVSSCGDRGERGRRLYLGRGGRGGRQRTILGWGAAEHERNAVVFGCIVFVEYSRGIIGVVMGIHLASRDPRVRELDPTGGDGRLRVLAEAGA